MSRSAQRSSPRKDAAIKEAFCCINRISAMEIRSVRLRAVPSIALASFFFAQCGFFGGHAGNSGLYSGCAQREAEGIDGKYELVQSYVFFSECMT